MLLLCCYSYVRAAPRADTAYPFPPSGVALVLGNEETGVDTRVMQVRQYVS